MARRGSGSKWSGTCPRIGLVQPVAPRGSVVNLAQLRLPQRPDCARFISPGGGLPIWVQLATSAVVRCTQIGDARRAAPFACVPYDCSARNARSSVVALAGRRLDLAPDLPPPAGGSGAGT